MDQEDIKELYEDKYERHLGLSYQQWLENGPKNEDEAYRRLNEIDAELESTYDEWYEAAGQKKDDLEESRDKLKAEYDFIEESFGLESRDKNY